MNPSWYPIQHTDQIDTPALLVYPQRVQHNIDSMIQLVGEKARLIPHIKTHKMAEVLAMYRRSGIDKFKCSTISEAEMAAQEGAAEVLLAYQPVGPKIERLLTLIRNFPRTRFSTLVDDAQHLRTMATMAAQYDERLRLFIDIDHGMGRTGIEPGPEAMDLYRSMVANRSIHVQGIHAYDGHLHQDKAETRQQLGDAAFDKVWAFRAELLAEKLPVSRLITSGSPAFATHLQREKIELSPGTTIFWDAKYTGMMPELPFHPAALVMTRIISKPRSNRLCLDLGHKSIASENPLPKRITFLNLQVDEWVMHSEEHLVIESKDAVNFRVGDVIYGVPYHICPTVALHQEAVVIENGAETARWNVVARNRRIVF